MKKLFFLLGLSVSLASQAQTLDWAKKFGGSKDDRGQTVLTDLAGNVYSMGSFMDTVDFDPGIGEYELGTVSGDYSTSDIYISKLDASGNFLWAKRIGNEGLQVARSMTIDAAGNLILCGRLRGTADFDPGAGVQMLTATDNGDVFVCKLSADGALIWVKQFGGTDKDYGFDAKTDAAGNIIVVGQFMGTADFDPGSGITAFTAVGIRDLFISKLTANGDFIWARKMGGSLDNNVWQLELDGNIYTTGMFAGTGDFNPGAGTATLTSGSGLNDIYISKLTTDGDYVWAKNFAGTAGYMAARAMAIDEHMNVYTAGYFDGTTDFDPSTEVFNMTPVGAEEYDGFICKLDAGGNFVWAKQIGGAEEEIILGMVPDRFGNLYTTGAFYGTCDFDPGVGTHTLTSFGADDIFISKYTSEGMFLGVVQMGGTFSDNGNDISVDVDNKAYITGFFNKTADFDPSAGVFNITGDPNDYEAFVVKLTTPLDIAGLTEKQAFSFEVYPNPNAGVFVVNSEQPVAVKLMNMNGQAILEQHMIAGSNTMQIQNVTAGIYLIHATAANGSTSVQRISIVK